MNLAVLASGAGTNLQALLRQVHGREGITITAVASDRTGAPALERAKEAGVSTAAFLRQDFASRQARDEAMADWLVAHKVELIALAGYLQLLTPSFLRRFSQRVINVHPALLPAFPGLDAVGQALQYGVKVFGVTVHFVDEGVDTGPVIFQRAVELPDAHTPEEVMRHLRPLEHELLPEAVRLIAGGRIRLQPGAGRRVQVER